MPSREEVSEHTVNSSQVESSGTSNLPTTDRIADPDSISAIQEPKAQKSEKTWWRKGGECPNPPPKPKTIPNTPTTPNTPALTDSEFQENIRYDYILEPRKKRKTLNDYFKTPKSITWKESKKFETADFYKDTITVSWDQSKENLRKEPNWPQLQKEKENHPHPFPSNDNKVITMEFLGPKRDPIPAGEKLSKKNGVSNHNSAFEFKLAKDAVPFRPSTLPGEKDAYPLNYDEYNLNKRPVKPDTHHLPANYYLNDKYGPSENNPYAREKYETDKYASEKYPPEKYPSEKYPSEKYSSDKYPSEKYSSEYSSRDSEYSSRSSLSRSMQHERHGDMYNHYPHTGYSEVRSHRADPSREHYHSRRQYDRDPRDSREAARMRYYESKYGERMPSSYRRGDARDRYEISEKLYREERERRRRDEYLREPYYDRYRDRESSRRRSSLASRHEEHYDRMVERQRYLMEMRRQGRGSGGSRYSSYDEYSSSRDRNDPRPALLDYYRMKQQEEMYNSKIRRHQGGGNGYSSYGQPPY